MLYERWTTIMDGPQFICGRRYMGKNHVKLMVCCLFIWSVCFTTITSHAHDVKIEVGGLHSLIDG